MSVSKTTLLAKLVVITQHHTVVAKIRFCNLKQGCNCKMNYTKIKPSSLQFDFKWIPNQKFSRMVSCSKPKERLMLLPCTQQMVGSPVSKRASTNTGSLSLSVWNAVGFKGPSGTGGRAAESPTLHKVLAASGQSAQHIPLERSQWLFCGLKHFQFPCI